jgi:hypothetical protein
MFVGLCDRPRVAIEVVQAHRKDVADCSTQTDIPIDLIVQAIPRKTDYRNTVLAD